MGKKDILIIADYSKEHLISFDELCAICDIDADYIRELIAYDVIHPLDEDDHWQFTMDQLKRIQVALRLQHDLEINLAGIAVVMDLLDELETLRSKAKLFEKHFLS